MSFYALQVSLAQIYYVFPQKPYKLFWTTLKKLIFAPLCKRWEHLQKRNFLCVHCPKMLNFSSVQTYNFLKELIQCSCSEIFERLFVATSQLGNTSRVQTLRLITIQLALITDPTVHCECWHAWRHGEIWGEHCACFGAKRLAQVCFDQTSSAYCK